MVVLHTPSEASRANAICERFVASCRRECLDHLLVIGAARLVRTLKVYVAHFNLAQLHQGTAKRLSAPKVSPTGEPKVGRVIAFPS
jgi:putative transposase